MESFIQSLEAEWASPTKRALENFPHIKGARLEQSQVPSNHTRTYPRHFCSWPCLDCWANADQGKSSKTTDALGEDPRMAIWRSDGELNPRWVQFTPKPTHTHQIPSGSPFSVSWKVHTITSLQTNLPNLGKWRTLRVYQGDCELHILMLSSWSCELWTIWGWQLGYIVVKMWGIEMGTLSKVARCSYLIYRKEVWNGLQKWCSWQSFVGRQLMNVALSIIKSLEKI